MTAPDPRIEPVTEYICAQYGVTAEDAELPTLAILGEADAHDPVRTLLSGDRAVNAVQRQVAEDGHLVSRRDVAFVLAALTALSDA